MKSIILFLLLSIAAVTVARADVDAGVPDTNGIATSPGAAAPTLSDPTDVNADWAMIKTYGPIWGGMIVAGALLMLGTKLGEDNGWLKQNGRLAMGLTAGTGLLMAVIAAKFANAGWAGVVVTAIGAIKLLLTTTPPKAA